MDKKFKFHVWSLVDGAYGFVSSHQTRSAAQSVKNKHFGSVVTLKETLNMSEMMWGYNYSQLPGKVIAV